LSERDYGTVECEVAAHGPSHFEGQLALEDRARTHSMMEQLLIEITRDDRRDGKTPDDRLARNVRMASLEYGVVFVEAVAAKQRVDAASEVRTIRGCHEGELTQVLQSDPLLRNYWMIVPGADADRLRPGELGGHDVDRPGRVEVGNIGLARTERIDHFFEMGTLQRYVY
jgi:hypothetical protein